MKKTFFKSHHLLILSTLGYTYLFWQQNLGINLFLFSCIMMVIAVIKWKVNIKQKSILLTLSGTVISGLMMLMLNSDTSKFAHIISFFVFLGFALHPEIKSIQYSLLNTLTNYASSFSIAYSTFKEENTANTHRIEKVFYYLRIIVIPIIFLGFFYIIYSFSNDKFSELSNNFWSYIVDAIAEIFEKLSIGEIFFFITGLMICGGIIYRNKFSSVAKNESNKSETVIRKRRNIFHQSYSMNALLMEYKMAVILLILVNILLLIVNALDIRWVWFGFSFEGNYNLSKYVHEGTYLLIISILLSMALIIYYFRRNLNFMKHVKTLRMLANLWILQNIVLTISVAIRNYHYIEYYALAYKRIGVIIFLILTIVGLLTMFLKINNLKSTYYLIKTNSLAVYVMMILMSCISWDELIINYNLNHTSKAGFDVDFCLELSPKAIPAILNNLSVIEAQLEKNSANPMFAYQTNSIQKFKEQIYFKAANFVNEQEVVGWQSWNYIDSKTLTQINNYYENHH